MWRGTESQAGLKRGDGEEGYKVGERAVWLKREDRGWEGCERERKKTIEYGTLLVGVCEQGFGTEWELGELKQEGVVEAGQQGMPLLPAGRIAGGGAVVGQHGIPPILADQISENSLRITTAIEQLAVVLPGTRMHII